MSKSHKHYVENRGVVFVSYMVRTRVQVDVGKLLSASCFLALILHKGLVKVNFELFHHDGH